MGINHIPMCIPLKPQHDQGCMDPETMKPPKSMIPVPAPMSKPDITMAQINELTKIENMDPVLKANIVKEFHRLIKINVKMKKHRALRLACAKYSVTVKF